ncbi:MAG: hypothetical protein U0892_08935 [Pirellulales bacterium]
MSEFLSYLVAAPVLPATCLLCLLILWSLWSLIGGLDLSVEGGSVDLETVDVDPGSAGDALSGLALAVLKVLNLRDVPLIIWSGTFAILYWLVSINAWILLDTRVFGTPGTAMVIVLIVRNVIFATLFTKFATQPLRGKFTSEVADDGVRIGNECEISTYEATTEFGQARYPTGGAPLLLNVRTDGPHLHKGDRVWITHYDTEHRVYIVSPTYKTISEVSSTPSSQENENE